MDGLLAFGLRLELGHARIDLDHWIERAGERKNALTLLRPRVVDGRARIVAHERPEVGPVWLRITGHVAEEHREPRGLGDDCLLGMGVILIGAHGKQPEQQAEIVAKRRVQARLLVEPRPDEGTQNQDAKPKGAHEDGAEHGDRRQRGNVIDPIEQGLSSHPARESLRLSRQGL